MMTEMDTMPVSPDFTLEELCEAFINGVSENQHFTDREKSLMECAFKAGALSENQWIKALTMMITTTKGGDVKGRRLLAEHHADLEEFIPQIPALLRVR